MIRGMDETPTRIVVSSCSDAMWYWGDDGEDHECPFFASTGWCLLLGCYVQAEPEKFSALCKMGFPIEKSTRVDSSDPMI
jgi:hypothetical protein